MRPILKIPPKNKRLLLDPENYLSSHEVLAQNDAMLDGIRFRPKADDAGYFPVKATLVTREQLLA